MGNVELWRIKQKEKQKRYLPHISGLDTGFRLIIPLFMGLVTDIKHFIFITGFGWGKIGEVLPTSIHGLV